MASNRRLGIGNSKSRTLLIEAADRLLSEEGFHAVSARRVAERAGLKPQLVHYYFKTMDALIVAVFQRACEQDLEQNQLALAGPQPLKALWKLHSNRLDTRRMIEFIAIGSHREPLRAEIVRAAEHFRAMQAEALSQILQQKGIDTERFSGGAMALLMAAISRALVMEASLGVTASHAELRTIVEQFLNRLDPASPAPAEPRPGAKADH